MSLAGHSCQRAEPICPKCHFPELQSCPALIRGSGSARLQIIFHHKNRERVESVALSLDTEIGEGSPAPTSRESCSTRLSGRLTAPISRLCRRRLAAALSAPGPSCTVSAPSARRPTSPAPNLAAGRSRSAARAQGGAGLYSRRTHWGPVQSVRPPEAAAHQLDAMEILVIALVALLGTAAGQQQQYDPYRGTEQFSGTPLYRGPGQASRPAALRQAGPSQSTAASQFSGSASQGPRQGPVGGPAPLDAVQKATEEFNRLYKEAAERAAAAPDDPNALGSHQPQRNSFQQPQRGSFQQQQQPGQFQEQPFGGLQQPHPSGFQQQQFPPSGPSLAGRAPFPGPGQPFPGPGQPFPGPNQPFPGSGPAFPGARQPFPASGPSFPVSGPSFSGPSKPFPGPNQPLLGGRQPFPGGRQPFPGSGPSFPVAGPSFPGSGPFFGGPQGGGPQSFGGPQFGGPQAGGRPQFGGPQAGGRPSAGRLSAAAAGPVSGPPQPVQDTPEVAAAKKAFFEEFRKRAKQAADAPDNQQLHQQQGQQRQPSFSHSGGRF
ncbi:translation initiation factor IF-2-like [Amphibalanus amphitrite]|uniref:translation initiation factor IF-2-like n=1 Tax=Amphibalanus amphitrite TaxID=1232801 RepID=UPI001C914531|nr:translation initiation factor IF-2-like [Amphibalanus amphitrite]